VFKENLVLCVKNTHLVNDKAFAMRIDFLKIIVHFSITVIFFLLSVIGTAQTTITGKVTDSKDGSPLPAVTVTVKGTTNSVQTDAYGNYSIKAPGNSTLVVTSASYSRQEIPVSNQNNVNFSLSASNQQLNEVVVVAYGTRRRGDLTGSVTSVSAKDFQKGNIASSEQLLLGKVAGLQVTTGGGSAGGGSRIRIRGGASLNATNDPLIVIDGVPVEGNGLAGSANFLNTINTDDIESISVLKDASATALYGSRASNGLIIITTKKGSPGKFKYNFNTQFSASTIADKLNLLSADEIRTIITADAAATGNNAYKNLLGTQNTDWQDQIYQTAFGNNNNLSISGTVKKMPVRVSVGYYNQEGILKTNRFDRYSASLNLSPKLFDDHLTVNLAVKASHTSNRFANEGAVGAAVSFDPTQPVYVIESNGLFLKNDRYFEWLQADGKPIDLATRNPLGLLEQRRNTSDVNRIIGNIQIDYKLHFFPDLHVLVNLGIDNAEGEGNDNIDSLAATDYKTGGKRVYYKQEKKNYLADVSLFYTKDIKTINSKIDVLIGHSYQDFITNVHNFPSLSYRAIADAAKPLKKDTIAGSEPTFLTDKPQYRLESYLGRLNFTLANKYLLTGSIRRDASSRFSSGTRIGYFPSAAAAWRLKEEFFKSTNVLSDLKLRLGWGITGQQGLKDAAGNDLFYPYLPRYSQSNSSAQYQFGNTFYSFLRPAAYDANIKWETTTTSNIGLDFAFLSNRISGSVDFYIKKTKDLLSVIPVAPGSNFDITLLTNVGNMENKGVEFTLNTSPVRSKDVSWDFGFNITYNKSEITNLLKQPDPNFKGIDVNGVGGGLSNYIGKYAVGHAPNVFYVYKQVYDKKSNLPIDGLFEDVNRDGQITDADRYFYQKPSPDVLLGINSQLNYRKWTFGMAAHGSFGNYLYNQFNSNNGVLRALKNPLTFINNGSRSYLDIKFTGSSINEYLSDYFIENASFLRLDNINIGFNAGKVLKNKANLRISGSVQNVFVITKYKGLDPEVSADGGVTYTIYPRPRIFSLGFNFDF
jgi:iron complex outermembrane receptor protein